MTIINSYYKKQSVLSNRWVVPRSKIKRNIRSQLSGFANIKLSVLIAFCLVLIVIVYISIDSSISRYDYEIYLLKQSIKQTTEENNTLKEKLIQNIAPEQIAVWAKSNNFVEVSKLDYFNISEEVIVANIIQTSTSNQ